jgi:mRNA interferase RelE/StbE
MPYIVKVADRAKKSLCQLERSAQERIAAALLELKDIPRPLGCKKLKASDDYRIRVGDYRIIYRIYDDVLVVVVIRIAHRKDAYRN